VRSPLGWTPAAVLVVGALLATVGVKAQRALPLRAPLARTVPASIEGFPSREVTISREEVQVVGMSSYLARVYETADTAQPVAFTLYVGFYEQQTQGRTVHSPKNCLPGAGWEALASRTATVATDAGAVVVNRYLIQKGRERALVFYWYQGRGRVAHDEYRVKWDLLRDAAIRRRSDEALVRVVVPLRSGEADADSLATRVTRTLVPAVFAALPA